MTETHLPKIREKETPEGLNRERFAPIFEPFDDIMTQLVLWHEFGHYYAGANPSEIVAQIMGPINELIALSDRDVHRAFIMLLYLLLDRSRSSNLESGEAQLYALIQEVFDLSEGRDFINDPLFLQAAFRELRLAIDSYKY